MVKGLLPKDRLILKFKWDTGRLRRAFHLRFDKRLLFYEVEQWSGARGPIRENSIVLI